MVNSVEVLDDYKNLDYFRPLSEDALTEVLGMTHVIEFEKDSEILRQNEPNSRLYFLMEGAVDVFVDHGKVATLSQQGDLLGEISLIRNELCNATIIAKTPVTLCYIEVLDLEYSPESEKITHLLYQIYAHILSIKLNNTNEKAKYFETLVHDLEESRRELIKINQALESKVINKTKILLSEPSKKKQNIAKMAIRSCGAEVFVAPTTEEAFQFIESEKIDIVFISLEHLDLVEFIRKNQLSLSIIVMTDGEIESYIENIKHLTQNIHFMSRNELNKAFTIKNFTSSINKLSTQDHFGIHKYMSEGADVIFRKVTDSLHRHDLNEEMRQYLKNIGVRSANLYRITTVTEELLMNAIYDAPHDMDGNPTYNHLPRTEAIYLKDNEQPIMSYACDGIRVAISLQDPFGALDASTIFKYLHNCYMNKEDDENKNNKGGAGRGLHQIIEGSDLVVFNLKSGVKTEIISIFHVDPKDAPENHQSFHIFYS